MESNKPETFKVALDFGGGRDHAPTELRLATSKPMNDQHLSDPSPILQAKLAPKQEIDAGSVEMRVSGFRLVPAKYDAKDKVVSFGFTKKLMPKTHTVVRSARVKGQRTEARWNFTVEGT